MTATFAFALLLWVTGMVWVHADRQLDRALDAAFNP